MVNQHLSVFCNLEQFLQAEEPTSASSGRLKAPTDCQEGWLLGPTHMRIEAFSSCGAAHCSARDIKLSQNSKSV